MNSHHARIGHTVATIHFPPWRSERPSMLVCSCKVRLSAPTPELLDLEWLAHRREVAADRARTGVTA